MADLPGFALLASTTMDQFHFLYAITRSFSSRVLDNVEKMHDLITLEPAIGLARGLHPSAEKICWRFEFKDVSFSYPTRKQTRIIADMSFRVSAGEHMGILGETGSGKSTLVSLLVRLYDPTEGSILLDGRDLREFSPLWLRRHIAVVSQDCFLPCHTIKENLLYGCYPAIYDRNADVECATTSSIDVYPLPSDDLIKEAMQIAQCHCFEDTERFPQGWHTDIGINGSKLSGGERQRLALARALLKRPSVLILDEATSALDEELQFQVQEALLQYHTRSKSGGQQKPGITILSIAHRLSNFRNADRLLVLHGGRVVEEGTPDELKSRPDGLYASYYLRHIESVADT